MISKYGKRTIFNSPAEILNPRKRPMGKEIVQNLKEGIGSPKMKVA